MDKKNSDKQMLYSVRVYETPSEISAGLKNPVDSKLMARILEPQKKRS
jgi:hypothetical protein